MKVATITGFVGQEPKVVPYGNEGKKFMIFTVGSSAYAGKAKGDDGGDYETTWFKIKVFGRDATYLESNLAKGDTVALSGDLRHDKYTNKEGVEVRSIEVNALKVEIVKKKIIEAPVSAPVSASDIPF